MVPNQTLNGLTARVLAALDPVLEEVRPDRVLVHGDTTTALAAALCAFNRGIPLGHVEAGLRTYDLTQPWPEEMNRQVADRLCGLLFAPTPAAADNLRGERLAGTIHVTGNTVIDALFLALKRIDSDPALAAELAGQFAFLDGSRRLVLVTGHRRENFGPGFIAICEALSRLAGRSDIEIDRGGESARGAVPFGAGFRARSRPLGGGAPPCGAAGPGGQQSRLVRGHDPLAGQHLLGAAGEPTFLLCGQ